MPLVRLSDDDELAPNLAPMIDVMLVLTIFFMCATKFSGDERKFDLDLPQTASGAVVEGIGPEILEVEAGGTLRLRGDEIAIDDLAARLASLRAERPDQGVMIRGENAVSHGRMTEVYEACRSAGVRQVAISVRPKTGSSGTQIR